MSIQELAKEMSIQAARLDEFKFWIGGAVAFLGVVAAIIVAAASAYIKNHVQNGIERGATEAQKKLDRTNAHEAKIENLESAISDMNTSFNKDIADFRYQVNKVCGELYPRISDLEKFNENIVPFSFDLPLAAGIAAYNPCKYWKTRSNEVKTNIRIMYTAFTNSQSIATLPEGYRPTHVVTVLAKITTSTGQVISGYAEADTDGSIRLYSDFAVSETGTAIIEQFCFIAK